MKKNSLFTLISLFAMLLMYSLNTSARWQNLSESGHRYNFINQYLKVKSDGHYENITEFEIEIFNESGRKDYGFFKLNYAPYLGDYEVLEAYTLNQEEKITVSNDMIEDKAIASSKSGFDNENQLSIAFPKVEVGSKLYMKFKYKTHTLSIKNFFSFIDYFGWREYYKKQNIFIESEKELFIEKNDPENVLEIENKKENGKFYVNIFQKKELLYSPIEEKESFLQKSVIPYIEISSEKEWSNNLLKDILEKHEMILTQPLPYKLKIAVENAKKKTNFKDQVEFLMDFIQTQIRYLGDWRTVKGALIPRDLEKIISSGFGDCKDYSALLARMLRELGYKANVAWVYRGTPYIHYPFKLPSLKTHNHAITYVKKDEKDYWFDTTNNMVFTAETLPDISERDALVLKENKIENKFISSNKTKNNIYKIEIEYSEIFGEFIKGHAKLLFKGIPASDWTGDELNQSKESINNRILEWISFNPKNINDYKISDYDLKSRITKDYHFDVNFTELNPFYRSNQGLGFIIWENSSLVLIGEELNNRVTDLYLKYPRETHYTHIFKNVIARNLNKLNCHIQSPWVDVKRTLTIKNKSTYLSDEIFIKKSYISQRDFGKPEISKLKKEIKACLLNKMVIFNK